MIVEHADHQRPDAQDESVGVAPRSRLRVRRGMACLYAVAVASSFVMLRATEVRIAASAAALVWICALFIGAFRKGSHPPHLEVCGRR